MLLEVLKTCNTNMLRSGNTNIERSFQHLHSVLTVTQQETVCLCDAEQRGALFLLLPDMRKALSRDAEKKSIIPLPHPVRPEDIE